MTIISKIERKCRLPEGLLIPTVMMFGGFGIMMISAAFPENSETGSDFIYVGAASICGGLLRSVCLMNRGNRQLAQEQRRQLLTSDQRNHATPGPPPPTVTPTTGPSASDSQPVAYVIVPLKKNNELQPMGSKTGGPPRPN